MASSSVTSNCLNPLSKMCKPTFQAMSATLVHIEEEQHILLSLHLLHLCLPQNESWSENHLLFHPLLDPLLEMPWLLADEGSKATESTMKVASLPVQLWQVVCFLKDANICRICQNSVRLQDSSFSWQTLLCCTSELWSHCTLHNFLTLGLSSQV